MELEAVLTIIFLTAALVLSLISALFPNRRLLKLTEENLTFILETLVAVVNELERIRTWIRELELEAKLEAEKKELGG